MNRGQSFVAYAQSPELMQPGDGPFDYPTGPSQITAMRCSTLGNVVPDAAFLQCLAVGTTIVSTIGLNGLGLFQRPPALSSNWVDAIDQGQQLRDVMPVGLGQNDVDRDALRIDEEVVLAARLTAIGWVRSTFFPPCTARTDELSATAREKSSLSAPRNLSRSTQCSLRHTPAFCQARSRRQQVMPEPYPISCGSISQGIPDCRTNRMPVSTRLSSNGLRPGCVLRRRLTGNSGWTVSHNSSSTSSRAILPRHDNYRRVAMTTKISFC
jgi:hypothetical protein